MTALPPPTTQSATWATALWPPFTLPPPPLDRIEAACAFATERGGVLVPSLTLLTLSHSHCASIESRWQAVQKAFSQLCLAAAVRRAAIPADQFEAACGLVGRSGLDAAADVAAAATASRFLIELAIFHAA